MVCPQSLVLSFETTVSSSNGGLWFKRRTTVYGLQPYAGGRMGMGCDCGCWCRSLPRAWMLRCAQIAASGSMARHLLGMAKGLIQQVRPRQEWKRPGAPPYGEGGALGSRTTGLLRSYSEPSDFTRGSFFTPKCSEASPKSRKNWQVNGLTDGYAPYTAVEALLRSYSEMLRRSTKASSTAQDRSWKYRAM